MNDWTKHILDFAWLLRRENSSAFQALLTKERDDICNEGCCVTGELIFEDVVAHLRVNCSLERERLQDRSATTPIEPGAAPMPNPGRSASDPTTNTVTRHVTKMRPFHLQSVIRHDLKMQKLKIAWEAEVAEERRARHFKARPFSAITRCPKVCLAMCCECSAISPQAVYHLPHMLLLERRSHVLVHPNSAVPAWLLIARSAERVQYVCSATRALLLHSALDRSHQNHSIWNQSDATWTIFIRSYQERRGKKHKRKIWRLKQLGTVW